MARIKIKDIPKDQKINKDEMKKVIGGALGTFNSSLTFDSRRASIIVRGGDSDCAGDDIKIYI